MEDIYDEGAALGRNTAPSSDHADGNVAEEFAGGNAGTSNSSSGSLKDLLPEIPTLDCTLDPDTCLVRAWCAHCGVHHQHGVPTYRGRTPRPGEILGHRVAHCDIEDSPYRAHGYYLRFACIKRAETPTPVRRAPDPCKAWGDRVVSFEEASRIVAEVAEKDPRYFLVAAIPELEAYPNSSHDARPYALCESRERRIRIPSVGVYLGSLVAELALLLVPGLGFESPLKNRRSYDKHTAGIAKLVIAAAGGAA